MKAHAGFRGGALGALMAAAVLGLSSPAYGAAGSGEVTGVIGTLPVDVSYSWTTSLGQVSLTVTNLQANPTSIIQAVSDVFFTVSGGTGAGGYVSPAASYINIAANGTVSAAGTPANDTWLLSNLGSGAYHLDVLAGGAAGPHSLIIGPAGAGGVYTAANGSIAGNGPHNPFIDQTAIFTLAITGVTADSLLSNIVFSFGTEGALIPIPAAVWLFASGLLGLIGIARRKLATQNALPMAA
jgi:hypothetical protein